MNTSRLYNLIPILLVLFFAGLVSLPFLTRGLYSMHDDQHVARLFAFDEALKGGEFPVRWVSHFGFGFGYPLFVFYPPFVYIAAELIHLLGFGFIDSIKTVFFLGIVASGCAIYLLTKEFWGKMPGVLASAFYILVPYRAVDVYVRGALAESFAFVWPPLILWSFSKLQKEGKARYLLASSVFLFLLMITHNLIFLPFLILLVPFLIFLIANSQNKLRFMYQITCSLIFAALLSAFFWMPALFEKKYTIVDDLLLKNLADYKIHFVYPIQLWNWTWGFGGSSAGIMDGISFKIGKLHVVTSILAFILAMVYLAKDKFKSRIPTTNYQLPTLIFALFLFSAYLTTFYSQFIWDLLSPLAYLQFPWRFLVFTALFSSLTAGAFVYLLKLPILRFLLTPLLLVLLFVPNLKLFQPQEYRSNLTDEIATSEERITWDVSKTSFEYLPKGVPLVTGDLGTNVVDIQKEDIPKEKIQSSSQKPVLLIISKPHKIQFTTDFDKEAQVLVRVFNFPGWQAKLDSKPINIESSSRLKLITLAVPSGFHKVELEFKDTPMRKIGNLTSLASIIFIIVFLLFKKRLKIY